MPGQLVHFEMPARDAGRAKVFYEGLFGWSFGPSTGPVEYYMTEAGDAPTGAIYPSESVQRGPIVYFDTEDIRASAARVRELGGASDEPQPIPHVGWFARCSDTEGNEFSLFQSDESVPAHGA